MSSLLQVQKLIDLKMLLVRLGVGDGPVVGVEPVVAVVADLINVLKADMETVIATEGATDINKRTEIIKQMLVIVQTSAKERM